MATKTTQLRHSIEQQLSTAAIMARLSNTENSEDELPSLNQIFGLSERGEDMTNAATPKIRIRSQTDRARAKLQTPRKRHTKEHSNSDIDEPKTVVKRGMSKGGNSLASSLSNLKLEPSDHERTSFPAAARRSPREAASRQRAYYIHDSIDLGAESTTADENGLEDDEDTDLSDFIVNDSASETELRRPRSVRKTQDVQKTPRKLVRRLHMKRPPSIYEDTDEEVGIDAPTKDANVIDLTSPMKRPSRGLVSLSDKENSDCDSRDTTLDLTKQLDTALRFAPPSRKTTKHESDAYTPPTSPSRPRLQSPTRSRVYIPTSPHRQSIDTFWSQGAVDEWNDVHSPKKTPRPHGRLLPLLLSPTKTKILDEFDNSDSADTGYESPSERSPKKSPSKSPAKFPGSKDRATIQAKKKFEEEKHDLASRFLAELDDTITKGEIARLSASTGGVKLEWNKKLNSTAGRAKWKREKTRGSGKPASSTTPTTLASTESIEPTSTVPEKNPSSSKLPSSSSQSSANPNIIIHHHASIELASKVIDDSHRLLNVIAHEFCHLTTFMISGIKDNPHGREFKSWASKVSTAFADRGIEVTTKHSYAIDYKYVWACTTCATEYKRHSKSIDPTRHVCSACKGSLLQIRPAPRLAATTASPSKAGASKSESTGSGYSAFVKANFATVKAELAEQSQGNGASGRSPAWGEVTAELAKRWKKQKAELGQLTSPRKAGCGSKPHNDIVGLDAVTSDLGGLALSPAA